jgi:hypothetical protein
MPIRRRALAVTRVAVVLLILVDGFVTATIERPDLLQPTVAGSDSANYEAAGERLNAGHNLYGPLLPGDRPIPRYPAEFPAPLLSPPLVAVIWRPLAVFGDPAIEAWWLIGLTLIVAVVIWFASVGGWATLGWLLALVALGWPLALMSIPHPDLGAQSPIGVAALSGNLNAYLLGLCVVTWWATAHGRSWLAGAAAATAAVLKLGPFALGWWLFVRRDWSAVAAFAATVAILGIVGLLGAGVHANVAFVRLALSAQIRPTSLSVPWLLAFVFHASPRQEATGTVVTMIVGLIAVFAARRHARISFLVTLLVIIFSSPVVLGGNFVLLLAAASRPAMPGPESTPMGRTRGRGVGSWFRAKTNRTDPSPVPT